MKWWEAAEYHIMKNFVTCTSFKSRKVRGVGHVAGIGEMRNA
jgi:hypothetical protein